MNIGHFPGVGLICLCEQEELEAQQWKMCWAKPCLWPPPGLDCSPSRSHSTLCPLWAWFSGFGLPCHSGCVEFPGVLPLFPCTDHVEIFQWSVVNTLQICFFLLLTDSLPSLTSVVKLYLPCYFKHSYTINSLQPCVKDISLKQLFGLYTLIAVTKLAAEQLTPVEEVKISAFELRFPYHHKLSSSIQVKLSSGLHQHPLLIPWHHS